MNSSTRAGWAKVSQMCANPITQLFCVEDDGVGVNAQAAIFKGRFDNSRKPVPIFHGVCVDHPPVGCRQGNVHQCGFNGSLVPAQGQHFGWRTGIRVAQLFQAGGYLGIAAGNTG